MTPDAHIGDPVRVSILERLVPSFAFAVAAISGAVGGVMLFRFFSALRNAESAGYQAFFGGVAEIEVVVGLVLVIAAALCMIGIIVSFIRLFTTNTTASPPGLLFLMTGLLSLVPAFAIHYVLHLMKGVVISPVPGSGGVSEVADTVMTVAYFAIGSAVVITLVLLAFSFIPFRSRAARKSSPLVCLMLVEIVIAVFIGLYFWEARVSIAERDKDRTEETEPVSASEESSLEQEPSYDPNGELSDIATGAANTDTGAASNLGGKTISGGVLNGKAIDLPQPTYPPAARAVRAAGAVTVQVLVDEKGEVVSANAVSGHPLLRASAVQAARKARFTPTKLSGKPVKVTGVLTFNFSEQ